MPGSILILNLTLALLWAVLGLHVLASANSVQPDRQRPLRDLPRGSNDAPSPQSVSVPFFASLERLARLVDIAYCVGTTGISPPFSCVSRCGEFPNLVLASTWNTGILMSDSCGYIAVDHSPPADNGGAIIVAFRGTYSITNTVVDLSTVPQAYVPYPAAPDEGDGDGDDGGAGGEEVPKPHHECTNCTVHRGFLASWRSARELVLPALRDLRARHPSYPVHLVGHSLGGAVAALAGLELRVSLGWGDDVTVTTFGEPRIGNDRLAAYVDAVFGLDGEMDDGYDRDLERRRGFRRVTHVDDPVPLLPRAGWGYRPHGGEVYITKAGLPPGPEDLRICRGDADRRCMAGAEARGAPLNMWQLFFAHRDYFWRLGLCMPGGDPADWGRERYNYSSGYYDEL